MSDYSTLAQRVCSSISGIRGCLMLSRDGMVLGAHPEGESESQLKSAWVRFASLGEADRSYIEFPDQTWAFVRRGGYGAFSIADAGVRPGILVDLLEQALMTGEQERAHDRTALRLPEAASAPSGKPRTSMHKPDRSPAPAHQPTPVVPEVPAARSDASAGREDPPVPDDPPVEPDSGPAPEPAERPEPAAPVKRPAASDEESEVDRILLAKEFAGLLQVPKEDDEASR